MAEDGKAGTELEIYALAQKHKFNIMIHQNGSKPLSEVFNEPKE